MSDFFHDRMQLDLERLAAHDGRVNIADMLAGWSVDPEWVAAALKLSPKRRRRLLADLGADAFDRDAGRYASELKDNTKTLDFVWSPGERAEMLRRHTEMLFAGVSDRLAFCRGDESRRALAEAELIGRDHVDAAREAGHGVMMLSVHQSHPAFALRHPSFSDLHFSAIVRQHGRVAASTALLRRGIGDRVEILGASRGSVRQMLRALQENHCVSVYIDFVFPHSTGVPTALFGQTVRISSSAVAIALRTRAAVVPVTVARHYPPESGRVSVECYQPLPLEDLDRHRPGDLEHAALRFGITAELLIRRYPEQWMLWDTLEHRWRSAENAQQTSTGK